MNVEEMTGMEILSAIQAGNIAPPPIALTWGMSPPEVLEPGQIRFAFHRTSATQIQRAPCTGGFMRPIWIRPPELPCNRCWALATNTLRWI